MDILSFEVSISLVVVIVTIFTISCISYILHLDKNSGHIGLFERSQFLLLIGEVCNYAALICNIINGIITYIYDCEKFKEYKHLLYPPFILSRLYAICMILRIYRLGLLNLFRSGEISHEFLTKRASNIRTTCLIVAYIILTLSLFIAGDYMLSYSTCQMFYWPYLVSYTIECFLFLLMSLKAYEANAHPTIVIEYFFYTVCWGAGSLTSNIQERWILQLPLKNCLLLLIATFSMHEHYKLIRPPLPLEICLKHIFSIEELYYDFKDYLKKSKNEDNILSCEMYCELTRGEFIHNFLNFKEKYDKSSAIEIKLKDLIEDSQYDDVKTHLEDELQSIACKYFDSKHYQMFKKSYYMNFN